MQIPPHKKIHIALDFDRTLAYHNNEPTHTIGKPIAPMVKNVKKWLAKGYDVSIFTARLSHNQIESARQIELIQKFLVDAGLPVLPITCMKMYYFTHIIDDRAYHCEPNKGIIPSDIDFNL